MAGKCTHCGRSGAQHTCGKCGKPAYCSAQCQTAHWSTHRIQCTSLGTHYGYHDYDYSDQELLTRGEVRDIMDRAMDEAGRTTSALRRDPGTGEAVSARICVYLVTRHGHIYGHRLHRDVWEGSIDVAKGKAVTAAYFSSDENALSSRSVGYLARTDTGSGAPLFGVGNTNREHELVLFPGGVPLYRQGRLVGAVGVSGDAVEVDERIAAVAAADYQPSSNIVPVAIPYVGAEGSVPQEKI